MPGTIAWDFSGPPPQGVAGHALFGGDYGNPLYAEFVGGGLLLRRRRPAPTSTPTPTPAGVPGTVYTDGSTPPAGGHVPFGGDFGNPNDPNDQRDARTGTLPTGDRHDPYA